MPDPDEAPDIAAAATPLRTLARDAIREAWDRAVAAGDLPRVPDADLPSVEVERPANPSHGDVATSLALKLARPYRLAPIRIAEVLAAELRRAGPADDRSGDSGGDRGTDLFGSIEVAPPGFVNLRFAERVLEQVLAGVLSDSAAWGRVRPRTPQRVNVEFVSANPTGPLHIGNARGAFVGDLLCRVLEAGGHRPTREYYFNDFGAQVRNLGASVVAIRAGRDVPEDGYGAAYVHELVRTLPDELAAQADRDADAAAWPVGRWASEQIRRGIEASLERLGVHFDVWKTESSLHDEGWVERAVDRLRTAGAVYEDEGATWFRSTAFGDDKDRVIRKSNGDATYFAADIGYVTEKFSRGFDHLIYIWGADHHGTVARLRNAAEAMGFDAAAVEILLTAWVRFIRDGVEISMSKRSGDFITLDELLAEIGVDAARWFFASRAPTTGIDFDIELAKRQSNENPVYYVQYAHARIASILRKANEAGFTRTADVGGTLSGEPEAALVRALVRLPEVIEDAATARETQGVTAFATDLATTFHAFYRDARVLDPDEPERTRARLAVVEATKITLANALGLLGISAPESM